MNTKPLNRPVDVLAVMREAAVVGSMRSRELLEKAIPAVVELIEAAKMANGDHSAPHDCYATGPLTGNPYVDLIVCPGCRLAAALAAIGSAP